MKKIIKGLLSKFGYELLKVNKNDLSLYYELYDKKQVQNKRFYNIGAGSFQHPAWTNIDYDSEWYKANKKKTLKGIQFDLLSLGRIPVDDNIAEVIYSSHTIEHITNEAAQNMFNEAYRMLKKGGFFRITTPNIELAYRAYKNNDRHYFHWIDDYSKPKEMERIHLKIPMNQASIQQLFLHHFAGPVSTIIKDGFGAEKRITDDELDELFTKMRFEEALDYCTSLCPIEIQRKYPGYHINWWNKDKLFSMLKKAGFKIIYLSAYGQSYCPILRNVYYFDNTHPETSLYVEAIK